MHTFESRRIDGLTASGDEGLGKRKPRRDGPGEGRAWGGRPSG